MRRQRHYTNEERALILAALAANDGNISKTARQLGIPRRTLGTWLENNVVGAQKLATIKNELADAIERMLWMMLDTIEKHLPRMIAGASLRDLLTSTAIAIDKSLLLRGVSVSFYRGRFHRGYERSGQRIGSA